ncbi:hypothetical protein VNO80_00754 [Phaseolus coccineus]|uniref:Uncharacterized protein n=1 Tax=Phaseolus coccineus TaxID=3886 RepID=A0AAN9RMC2_PHACN
MQKSSASSLPYLCKSIHFPPPSLHIHALQVPENGLSLSLACHISSHPILLLRPLNHPIGSSKWIEFVSCMSRIFPPPASPPTAYSAYNFGSQNLISMQKPSASTLPYLFKSIHFPSPSVLICALQPSASTLLYLCKSIHFPPPSLLIRALQVPENGLSVSLACHISFHPCFSSVCLAILQLLFSKSEFYAKVFCFNFAIFSSASTLLYLCKSIHFPPPFLLIRALQPSASTLPYLCKSIHFPPPSLLIGALQVPGNGLSLSLACHISSHPMLLLRPPSHPRGLVLKILFLCKSLLLQLCYICVTASTFIHPLFLYLLCSFGSQNPISMQKPSASTLSYLSKSINFPSPSLLIRALQSSASTLPYLCKSIQFPLPSLLIRALQVPQNGLNLSLACHRSFHPMLLLRLPSHPIVLVSKI